MKNARAGRAKAIVFACSLNMQIYDILVAVAIHFEITAYPCNLIGFQQCDLFPNCTTPFLVPTSPPSSYAYNYNFE